MSAPARFSGRVCVVTGAANGMGRAFALALAREGALLAACDIDEAGLESLLHPTFDECDDESLLELDDEYWEALILDDDYEVMPEEGDFWFDQEAA